MVKKQSGQHCSQVTTVPPSLHYSNYSGMIRWFSCPYVHYHPSTFLHSLAQTSVARYAPYLLASYPNSANPVKHEAITRIGQELATKYTPATIARYGPAMVSYIKPKTSPISIIESAYLACYNYIQQLSRYLSTAYCSGEIMKNRPGSNLGQNKGGKEG